ncbi:ketopantoate reductase family protein [Aliarcobacter butzleri]|uniref:ketopantoate reductase family protein n=1 Tax=Aliarcobacter butzleri TaxID=28197 RepID=UPI00125FD858|nr:2-dehydropantoate 2-reductase [Aliarcobacter butzleri]MDK2063954.1 2-dehydropantoate 2-reductase [Aliarcobacter butzleri]
MNIVVIGAGGVGVFYGVLFHKLGHNVKFVARGKNLEYLKENKIKLTHSTFSLNEKIEALSIEELVQLNPKDIDIIFLATKSMSTENISLKLEEWTKNKKEIPYFISLQNGVENEDIMCEHYNKEFVISGLTRLIAAHTITLGHVESTGEVQTILGAMYPTKQNQEFLENLKKELDKTNTTTFLSQNIKLELWNKLIINNGLNAICALLGEKTGTLINDKKVSKLIYGLMSETALASKVTGVDITKENVDKMFGLMTKFESIKPSMLIDLEKNRDLELEDICGVVIKNCEKQGLDAPYTRAVSTILEFSYNKQRKKQ